MVAQNLEKFKMRPELKAPLLKRLLKDRAEMVIQNATCSAHPEDDHSDGADMPRHHQASPARALDAYFG